MGIGIIQIAICLVLIYALYKTNIIADKISVNKNKLRLGLVIFIIVIVFQNTNFASILFYTLLSILIYILYNPDVISTNLFHHSIVKKLNLKEIKRKKRVFVLCLAFFTVLPSFFWMFNENYKENEFKRLAKEDLIREAEEENAEIKRKEEERTQKIEILEESGIQDVLLIDETEQDRLFDSIENKSCREEWLKKIYDDFGISEPNLRKGVDNYNINNDCDYARNLHSDLFLEEFEKQQLSKATTIRKIVSDYKKLGILGANQKYAKTNFDIKNCKILQISEWSNWTGYTIHLSAGSSASVNCNMDYDKTEGAEILGKLRVGSRVNLNAVVDGSQVDVYEWGDVTIRLENGTIW